MDRRLPRSVTLAIRSAWTLVGVMVLTFVLMGVFHNEVLGSWADRHPGARQAFDLGGRAGLVRAGFVPPSFLPVAGTMCVVAAMLVWVLTVFFREGHRWGQLGLSGFVLTCLFASVVLGFRLSPPPVFVVVAVVSLVVEGVTAVCLWHRDTLAYLSGPWVDDVEEPGSAPSTGGHAA